jgi:hypothetical protein
MVNGISLDDFTQEVTCTFKDEQYKVRDNGAVMRWPRVGKRFRAIDNEWTFGKPNFKTGYTEIACIPIHRIVARAFLGEPPTPRHVVDHIDTNKRNNRPENLRWVTRLENLLLNPITAKRIIIVCGSIEAFLADPSKFSFPDPNYEWMRTVSIEEAQASYQRLLAWAENDKLPSGGSLNDWIFNRPTYLDQYVEQKPGVIESSDVQDAIVSKTPNAVQRDWRTPSEFPCCPQEYTGSPILAYAENAKTGLLFCQNDLYSSNVAKTALSSDQQSLFIITHGAESIKEWGLAEITYENEVFVHLSRGTFFTELGAEKQFVLAQGLEWTGEDSVDDYC